VAMARWKTSLAAAAAITPMDQNASESASLQTTKSDFSFCQSK
jgi:hypothetical protein